MAVVSILAAPPRADLDGRRVEALRRRLGGEVHWLAPGIAAELAPVAIPPDFAALQDEQAAAGFDLVASPDRNRRKRLLLADMDSTMIGQECIDELAERAGVGARVRAVTARAMNGEIDFAEALTERVALLAGLPQAAIAAILAERITLSPGGPALVATMRAHGAHAALVSGGFTAFTAPIAHRLGFDEHRGNVLLVENGKLTGGVARPILGQDAKLQALRDITAARGLATADAVAVGDGANDLAMITEAGLGVALHAKPSVAARAPVALRHADLSGLLYLQGYHGDEIITPAG